MTDLSVVPGKTMHRNVVLLLPEKREGRLNERERKVVPVESTHSSIGAAKC